MGCPVPINYKFNRLILFTFLPWFIRQAMIPVNNCMCKQKRKEGWSALLVEITSFMGAALKSLFDKENTVFIRYHSLTINKHLSKLDTPPWYVIDGRHPRIRLAMACVSKGWEECQIFYAISIWFQKLKSSSTWFNPCFPLRRALLLLFMLSQ